MTDRLSYSQLTAYQACPKGYALKYIDRVPQEPQGALIGGRAIHATIEASEAEGWREDPGAASEGGIMLAYFHAVLDGRIVQAGDAIRWAGRKTREFPRGEDASWWHRQGGFMLRRYQETRTSDLAGFHLLPGGAERRVVMVLPSGIQVVGFIDAFLGADRDGEAVIVDYSTGRVGAKSPMQGASYARAVREIGFETSKVVYVYLRAPDRARRIHCLDVEALLPFVQEQYETLAAMVGAGWFPPNPSAWHESCSVRQSWPLLSGALHGAGGLPCLRPWRIARPPAGR